MSGGGGGGGSFAPPETAVDCARLRFTARLQSLQEEVVATISVGDQLEVLLGTGQHPVIEVRDANGEVAGALIDHVTDLLRCIQDGYQYVAEVKSVDGGDVRVEVRCQ
jgi:hypothetical protein